jgi:hypothetical protein
MMMVSLVAQAGLDLRRNVRHRRVGPHDGRVRSPLIDIAGHTLMHTSRANFMFHSKACLPLRMKPLTNSNLFVSK